MALSANFQVERMYKILKNGAEMILSEAEVKAWLDTPEVRELMTRQLGNTQKTGTTLNQVLEKYENEESSQVEYETDSENQSSVAWTRRVKLPLGFGELTRSSGDPKNAYKESTFVYAKNNSTGEYGFRVISKRGKKSPFNKLGRISDPDSLIGSFLRAIPLEKTMIKRDFFGLNIPNVTEGRRLKALVEILEYEKYLEKKQLLDRNGRYGYTRTQKMDGLEAWIRNELNEPLLTSNP